MNPKIVVNIGRYQFGAGVRCSAKYLRESFITDSKRSVLLIDQYFKDADWLSDDLGIRDTDSVYFIDTTAEPTTSGIDHLVSWIKADHAESLPGMIIAMGGGSVLDTGKAVSNVLANGGKAQDYQGWDLVPKPGVPKLAIPTLSGTGAEASRTCVITNKETGIKLGMNSDHSVYDTVLLDPELTKTVPRNLAFITAMDSYIHAFESLQGIYRSGIGDAFSEKSISLCRESFGPTSSDFQSDENRERIMIASYLGGCAIASSYVGLVHPFSAGLSVVFGTKHCLANCIAMRAMKNYYPKYYNEFWGMVDRWDIDIPYGIAKNASDTELEMLYSATLAHEKPLMNALGEDFKSILTPDRVIEMFLDM